MVDETNVDISSHVESSSQWIRALEARAYYQLRIETKSLKSELGEVLI